MVVKDCVLILEHLIQLPELLFGQYPKLKTVLQNWVKLST